MQADDSHVIRAPPTFVGGAILFSACPSVCPPIHLSVVILAQSFLIGFLPNFIYGLLQSTSRSSSYTGFVRHPLTKMANNMAATYQYPLSWSLLCSLFNQISSKFHEGLLPPTFLSSSNTGFVRHPLTKMADKMVATYQYPLSWSLLCSHF